MGERQKRDLIHPYYNKGSERVAEPPHAAQINYHFFYLSPHSIFHNARSCIQNIFEFNCTRTNIDVDDNCIFGLSFIYIYPFDFSTNQIPDGLIILIQLSGTSVFSNSYFYALIVLLTISSFAASQKFSD